MAAMSRHRRRAAQVLTEGLVEELEELLDRFTALTEDVDTIRGWGESFTFDPRLVDRVQRLAQWLDRVRSGGSPAAADSTGLDPQSHASGGDEGGSDIGLIVDIIGAEPDRVWTVSDLLIALKVAGWQTTSNSPRNTVANAVGKAAKRHPDKVQIVERGRYRAAPDRVPSGHGVPGGHRAPVAAHDTGETRSVLPIEKVAGALMPAPFAPDLVVPASDEAANVAAAPLMTVLNGGGSMA
jgi:hypothetical protein